MLAAEAGSATAETMTMLHAQTMLHVQFGLDQLFFPNFSDTLATSAWGSHRVITAPVMDLIMAQLHSTLLMLLSQTIAIVFGIALGAVMAVWVGKWPDHVLSLFALLLYSTPGYWIGLMTLILFSIQLDWLPSSGNITIGAELTGWAYVADMLRHAILPVLALSNFFIAIDARLTRAAMLEIAQQDFVRTAHTKGLTPWFVTGHHILR
ncbi:MAG: ABC transporter permease [Symbiopectobacterium sp.]